MLLLSLIAFGLAGIVSRYLVGSRMPVILFLSAGTIALLNPASLLFCVLVAIVNYFLLGAVHRKSVFVLSVIFNLLVLLGLHGYELIYKEFYWAGIPVLVGITFLSLQHIAFFFELYYNQSAKPRNFLFYMTAVLYFPKFFSGPIASLSGIQKQIDLPSEKMQPVSYGLNRILLGLFKKLVLAESLAPMVHSVLDFKDAYPGLTVLTAAFLYSLQLYFDFAGYSDMAIGISSIWGIDLPKNFNFPFRQKSWTAFWKSWHSSLTQWLWTYVFNPAYLFFSRKKTNKIITALFCSIAVFASMAFFNGLKSGFYISAALFAFFYFTEVVFNRSKSFFNGVFIFILFSVALLFFRNPDSKEYTFLTDRLMNTAEFIPTQWPGSFLAPLASGGTQQDYFNLTVTLSLCGVFLLFERKITHVFSVTKINYTAWFIIMVLLFTWGVFESGERFIYMQF